MNKSHPLRVPLRRLTVPSEVTQKAAPAPSVGEIEGLITKRELSRRLKKTIRTIDLHMRRRRLPYYKLGHSVLFDWQAVLAAMRRQDALPGNSGQPSAPPATAAPAVGQTPTAPRIPLRPGAGVLPRRIDVSSR